MKKKHFITLYLFLSIWILSGCIGDSLKNCPTYTTLYFNFPKKSLTAIDRVNVGIFDKDGIFVQTVQLEQSNLKFFQGVNLSLFPGDYTAVCWGNSFGSTEIKGFTTGSRINEGLVLNPNYETGGIVTSNDSLYYGKKSFSVEPNVANKDSVFFTASYNVIAVRIEGYASVAGGKPVVRINNLDAACNFNKVTNDSRDATYFPFIWREESNAYTFVSLVLPLTTSLVNNITVNILKDGSVRTAPFLRDDSVNNILCTIDLNTFITENNITLSDSEETIIPILVTFMNGDVAVTLDKWKEVPTHPEI